MINKNEIIAYTYDFLSFLFETLELKISKVLLFGSVVRGDSDGKSDIDLFIEPKNPSESKVLESQIRKTLARFEIKAEHDWALKFKPLPIRFFVGDLKSDTWKELREEIISHGLVLFDRFREYPASIGHYSLVTYSLAGKTNRAKMDFLRRLFGYRIRRQKKDYAYGGMLEKIQGIKLAPNAVLVKNEELQDLRKLLNKYKIKAEIREIWLRC
ncbi:MAG: nucleotidyltransferase domain-containing protein [Candidatus Woesearchaeota archaeon]